MAPVADELGVDLYSAGTHPFAEWSTQLLTPGHRYEELIDRTQWWGRQMLIWGVHVHVGVAHRDQVMPVLSSLLNHYPHLQALSASSPMWAGTDTGYASNRAMMFQQLPTAGLPFQFETWEEFEAFVADKLITGVIDELSEIRWDMRPVARARHRSRCGSATASPTSRELAALAALTHCLVVDLDHRLAAGETLPTMPPWHVQENKWRAARYGMDAEIILDAAAHERLVTDDLDDLLDPARAGRASGWAAPTSSRSVEEITRARGVVPAAAGGGGAHRRRPGRRGRLGGARARPQRWRGSTWNEPASSLTTGTTRCGSELDEVNAVSA